VDIQIRVYNFYCHPSLATCKAVANDYSKKIAIRNRFKQTVRDLMLVGY
jgi:hypothetical protein